MPQFAVRNPNEVPQYNYAPREIQMLQREYDAFIRAVASSTDIGELHLEGDENMRSVKVRLRRSAARLREKLEIWDKNGLIYFRVVSKKTGK